MVLALLIALAVSSAMGKEPPIAVKLSKKAYSKFGDASAVVLFTAGWGRAWNCGGFENAELRGIGFDLLPVPEGKKGDPDILVEGRSGETNYAFLVRPGSYAIAFAKVKVAASMTDIRYLKLTRKDLLKEGRPIGGTFSANSGEVVYIGHFGLDCTYQPIPWRYYLNSREDFNEYISDFRKKYPFVHFRTGTYRLFDSKEFGQPHELKGK